MAYTISALLGNSTALAHTCHLIRTAAALTSTGETRYVTVSVIVCVRLCICVCVCE
jgi:hypothetical protein